MRTVLTKSLQIRGFIQREFASQRDRFYNEASEWLARGQLRYREDIVDGLENAPEAPSSGSCKGAISASLSSESQATRRDTGSTTTEFSTPLRRIPINCSCCQFWYRALDQSQESGVASPATTLQHATLPKATIRYAQALRSVAKSPVQNTNSTLSGAKRE